MSGRPLHACTVAQVGVLLLGAPWLSTADARPARRPRAPGLLAYDVQATCQAYLAKVRHLLSVNTHFCYWQIPWQIPCLSQKGRRPACLNGQHFCRRLLDPREKGMQEVITGRKFPAEVVPATLQVQEVLAPGGRQGARGDKGPRAAWRRLAWPSLRLGLSAFLGRLGARMRWLTSAQQQHQ